MSALLRVRGLRKHFPIRRGLLRRRAGAVKAVDGLDFQVTGGETLGLVGESGSGKSTAGRAILQLVRPTSGRVEFDGVELTSLAPQALRQQRRHLQMIFQDPYASLNPRATVERAVSEPLQIHGLGDGLSRRARVDELLSRVGLDRSMRSRYPHELSGGQRQRVGIARALATSPRFIVADEPISALDVSIQAQVTNLLEDLKADLGLTYLFIAHDLAMVRHVSDRVAVMYLGRIVELGPTDGLFDTPLHPYTKALISAIPIPDPAVEARRDRITLSGDVPDPAQPPTGCPFHPRCPFAVAQCREVRPELRDLGLEPSSHQVACHRAEELA